MSTIARESIRRSGVAASVARHGLLAVAAAAMIALALPGGARAEEAAASDDPYAKFIKAPLLDEFNLDVKAGKVGTPTRGGTLRLRTKVDFQHFNPITVTGQPERYVVTMAADGLLDRDVGTWEIYPVMAWHWREADAVKVKGQDVQYGRIVSEDETSIRFLPGAQIHFFAKNDLEGGADVKPGDGTVTLKQQWGGGKVTGKVAVRPHTLSVDTAADAALADKIITIPRDTLDTWEDDIQKKTRPFLKPRVVVELYIRPGITWHDGQPFTARDVEFTYNTIRIPEVEASTIAPAFKDVQTVEVFDNDMAIRVVNGRPYFNFTAVCGLGRDNPPIPKHIFNPDQYGGDTKAFAEAFKKHPFRERPILTGAYRFKEWRKGNYVTLERNPDYWASKLPEGSIINWKPEQPYLDEISWFVIGENQKGFREVEKQAIDVDDGVEQDIWMNPDAKSDAFMANVTRATKLGFGYVYIGWNLDNPIFKDQDTRRALAMLIPSEEIAEKIHYGLAKPVSGPMFLGGPGYDHSVDPVKYDPQGARRLLRKAGWADRDGDGILDKEVDGKSVPFRFSYSIHTAKDYHRKMADIVKEKVGEAGIDVSIQALDWTIFSDTVRDRKFDAVRFAWTTDLDPDPFQIWHSSNIANRGDNFVGFRNDRVDEICVSIREQFDPLKRWEMAREMHRIVASEQPYCFLFAFIETYFINRGLQGVRLYPSSYPMDYREWYWAKQPPEGAAKGWKGSK